MMSRDRWIDHAAFFSFAQVLKIIDAEQVYLASPQYLSVSRTGKTRVRFIIQATATASAICRQEQKR
jgi:hypothetical protein